MSKDNPKPNLESVKMLHKNAGFLVRIRSALRNELTSEEKTLLIWQIESMINDYSSKIKTTGKYGKLNGFGIYAAVSDDDLNEIIQTK